MSKVRFFATLATALLLVTTFTFAHDGKDHDGKEHSMKIKIDGDMEAIAVSDLEVGETRQLYTDSGKEVVITREEDGYHLTVDGKDIDILSPGHHKGSFITVGGEDGEHKVEVVVKGSADRQESDVFLFSGDGAEHKAARIFVVRGEDDADGEHGFAWVQGDEDAVKRHTVSYVLEGKSVLDQVLDSKVLDSLDEATRQEILDVIKKAEGPRVKSFDGMHKIVIDVDDEDHDE